MFFMKKKAPLRKSARTTRRSVHPHHHHSHWIALLGVTLFVVGFILSYLYTTGAFSIKSEDAMKAEQYDDDIIYLKASTPKAEYIDAYKVPDDDLYHLMLHADWDAFSKVAPKTKKDIEWVAYNFTGFDHSSITYSFVMPWHGPYCEGCFDGWAYGEPRDSMEGRYMGGGYYELTDTGSWTIKTGIMTKEDPLPAMFESMLSASVGSIVQVTDAFNSEIGGAYTATRLPNKVVGNETFAMYSTTDPDTQEYALLDKGTHLIIFGYGHKDPVYDVFDTIISSFKPILREDAVYGTLPPVENLDGYEQIERPE